VQAENLRGGHDGKGQSSSDIYLELGVDKPILSQNEKRVLFGMVKFPNLNDRKISERIGLKLSTFTAIKNRLKKSEYFRQVRLPNMEKLDKELAFIGCIWLNPGSSTKRAAGIVSENLRGWGDVFYAVSEVEHLLVLGYSDNYSSFKKRFDETTRSLLGHGLLDPRSEMDMVILPLDQTQIQTAFDYSGILEICFEVEYSGSSKGDGPRTATGPETKDERASGMGAIERRVLCGLIEYPDIPDNTLAREVRTTRQAVARIKKRLEKRGVIRTVKVPELRRLGLEILSYIHISPMPDASGFAKGASPATGHSPMFFQCMSSTDIVCLSAHRNYREFQEFKSHLLSQYLKRPQRNEPTVVLFPIPFLENNRSFDFQDLVTKAVERP